MNSPARFAENSSRCWSRSLWVALLAVGILLPAGTLRAEDTRLNERQSGLAQRYQQLEELFLRLAEVEAAENPERSALLRRAARQSRDKFVLEKMRLASASLKTEEFQLAVDNQKAAHEELSALLNLLMSEDRSKRIRDEKERLAKIAKDIKRTIRAQQATRARTENGADLDEVEREQDSIAKRTEKIALQLAEDNAADPSMDPSGSPSSADRSESGEDSEPGGAKEENSDDKKPGEEGKLEDKDSEDKDSDGKDKDKKPGDGDQSPSGEKDTASDPKASGDQPSGNSPSENQPAGKNDSPPQQGPKSAQPPQGSPSQDSPPAESPPSNRAPQTPEQEVEQQLRQAMEKMRQAEEELKNSKRDKATAQQRAAEENLRAAIDRLERILRQLREEEMQRELAKLESRLRKMAAMQSKVLDDTVALAETPKSQRNRQTDLKAGDLAFEEKKITMEADRAMLLLREEGSSVAFPEVILQISGDTKRVADFLAESKIDTVTQGIQRDILAALEEMIAATQQAQRDLEQKQQQQQGKPQQGGQQEEPLVEALAELRLIRTMETRIKSTTERYDGLIESGDQAVDDILPLLQDLSDRQNRLYRITRDLVTKRNN